MKKSRSGTADKALSVGDKLSPLWLSLRQSVLQPERWFELARHYAAAGFPWQAGYTARQALRLDAALLPRLQALNLGAWQNTTLGDALLGRPRLDDAAALAERFLAQLQICPGDWLSTLYLARLLDLVALSTLSPAWPDAVQVLQQAEALEPIHGESRHWLGAWRLKAGDAAGAVQALSGVLAIRPMRFGSMMILGEALLYVGHVEAAEKAFTRAALSSNPDFLQTLAAKVFHFNYWQEAIAILRRVLELRPYSVPAWLQLARIQSEAYALVECRESLQKLAVLAPDNVERRTLESSLSGRMGDAKANLRHFFETADEPDSSPSRRISSIAMSLLYQDNLSVAAVAKEHRKLCAPIMDKLPVRQHFDNDLDPQRRLRIGYVTGDLHRQHPVNIFILPVLLRHDHTRFEITIYHTNGMHDGYTQKAKENADRWVEVGTDGDEALQQRIVADEIDLLIDLAGHTASHRLGVFAMRAAPVQATFLGYPHSTGLSTIDWLIGDAVVSPKSDAALFSEGIAQLPNGVFCWATVDEYPLPKTRPATLPVVFASFNNGMKISDKTVALWARVLNAVPDSQLMLKTPAMGDASVQARYTGLFAAHGIAPERLLLRGPSGLAVMMQDYGEVDIALDPTPYNGGTTTLQALWMGVPVVTLAGANFVSRMGASFMTVLGQPDWVAKDEDAYVAIAQRLAQQLSALRTGRAALRQKMAASPLCTIETYVRDFEALLREMWRVYCTNPGRRFIAGDSYPAEQ